MFVSLVAVIRSSTSADSIPMLCEARRNSNNTSKSLRHNPLYIIFVSYSASEKVKKSKNTRRKEKRGVYSLVQSELISYLLRGDVSSGLTIDLEL
jgi:hypothetical protein